MAYCIVKKLCTCKSEFDISKCLEDFAAFKQTDIRLCDNMLIECIARTIDELRVYSLPYSTSIKNGDIINSIGYTPDTCIKYLQKQPIHNIRINDIYSILISVGRQLDKISTYKGLLHHIISNSKPILCIIDNIILYGRSLISIHSHDTLLDNETFVDRTSIEYQAYIRLCDEYKKEVNEKIRSNKLVSNDFNTSVSDYNDSDNIGRNRHRKRKEINDGNCDDTTGSTNYKSSNTAKNKCSMESISKMLSMHNSNIPRNGYNENEPVVREFVTTESIVRCGDVTINVCTQEDIRNMVLHRTTRKSELHGAGNYADYISSKSTVISSSIIKHLFNSNRNVIDTDNISDFNLSFEQFYDATTSILCLSSDTIPIAISAIPKFALRDLILYNSIKRDSINSKHNAITTIKPIDTIVANSGADEENMFGGADVLTERAGLVIGSSSDIDSISKQSLDRYINKQSDTMCVHNMPAHVSGDGLPTLYSDNMIVPASKSLEAEIHNIYGIPMTDQSSSIAASDVNISMRQRVYISTTSSFIYSVLLPIIHAVAKPHAIIPDENVILEIVTREVELACLDKYGNDSNNNTRK